VLLDSNNKTSIEKKKEDDDCQIEELTRQGTVCDVCTCKVLQAKLISLPANSDPAAKFLVCRQISSVPATSSWASTVTFLVCRQTSNLPANF